MHPGKKQSYPYYGTGSCLMQESLRIRYIPDEEYAFSNPDVQKDIADMLFDQSAEQITAIERDAYFKYFNHIRKIQKINVRFDQDKKKSFYLKNSWEGKYLEGCGMALHNIFFDRGFNFILSEKKDSTIIAVEEIEGKTLWDIYEDDLTNEMIRNYGSALEFAAMIGLADRDSRSNFIITPEKKVLNIDYGKIFQRQYNHPIAPCIHIPKKFRKQLEYGRVEGREMLRERLEDKKDDVESLIEQISELKGFENTKYQFLIHEEYEERPYDSFMKNLMK